jgi:hypothetical protein
MLEDATVEARNIVEHLQNLNGYPDDPYSRYMAGFCFELFRDPSNAALQYRNANKLIQGYAINEKTGVISPATEQKEKDKKVRPKRAGPPTSNELVCFVLIGRSPSVSQANGAAPAQAPHAEIFVGAKCLGRSYPLVDVALLIQKTQEKDALLQAGKDVIRLGAKLALAHQIKQKDELLGSLVEFALLAMDSPDERRWGALPRWLQVARLPCPSNLSGFEVVFKNANHVFRRTTITAPIARFGKTYVSFCRDLPPAQVSSGR